MHMPTPLVLLAALLHAGCGAPRERDAVTERDSAGITIVENAQPALPPEASWRIDPEPVVRIGTAEGEAAYLLHIVRQAVRLDDGRIAVMNGGTQEVRFYDAQGRHLHSVGGRGGGPGEFEFVTAMLRMDGDSLLLGDANNARFTLLDADGRFVRSHPADWRRVSVRGRRADGRLALVQYADAQLATATGYQRVPRHAVLFEAGGTREDTVATLPGGEEFRVDVGGGVANYEVPFGRQQHVAVHGDRIYNGTGDTFEIEVRSTDRGLERLIRAALPPRAVTSADVERWRSAHLERAANNPRFRPAVERLLSEAPVPRTMPAYSALHVDRESNVWARAYAPADEPATQWQVFDPAGRWIGAVELPDRAIVTEIGDDYVLVVARDELDIESVRLYRLRKHGVDD
jgi:hypothetical protein